MGYIGMCHCEGYGFQAFQGKGNLVCTSREFELSEFELSRFYCIIG